ncbi:ORF1 [Grizzly bear anellovirus 6]|nr:ORF1 [Grizzly bear anellovirus 6]
MRLWRLAEPPQTMPYRYRWRRRRIPRRRHQLYHRRRRFWRRRRRRHYRGRRSPAVRAKRPRRIVNLTVRGFEFLGVQGSTVNYNYIEGQDSNPGQWAIDITNVAPSNKEVDWLSKIMPTTDATKNSCDDRWATTEACYWNMVGGWGQAEFTLRTLIFRALLGFARFNRLLTGFQFIRFSGYRWKLIRAPSLNYLLLPEDHRSPGDYEKGLIHPANLLNTPGTVLVESVERTKCCRSPSVRRKADSTIFGWHDLEDFLNVRLTGYVWSIINMDNPIGKNPNITKGLYAPISNNWMNATNDPQNQKISTYCPKWIVRDEYDSEFVKNVNNFQATNVNKKAWWKWDAEDQAKKTQTQFEFGRFTPFVAPIEASRDPEAFWFRYIFFFQLGGYTLGRQPPAYPVKESDVCTPCHTADCSACIYPEDLTRWGLLKKAAYERITGSPERARRRMVAKLAKLIRLRQRKQRKRVRWADEEGKGVAKIKFCI